MESRSTRWTALALGVAAGAAWVLSTNQALAQPAEAADESSEELGPEAGAKRPAGPDERSGHVLIQGRIGYAQPFGSLAADQPASRVVSGGLAFGAHAGIGLSRVTVLEVSGSYALLPAATGCSDCSGRSLDLGLGFVYHLAQGIAFDPWISYGVGYRRASFSWSDGTFAGPAASDAVFHGLDVARIALGGDFYPVPSFGVGLFAELDAGTYLSRPGERSGAAAYGFFQAGVRLALDPVPRGAPRPAAAGTSRRIAVRAAGARDAGGAARQ
ncbi:hypothetical protein SOCE26_045790 [Sorangium cellulosum]|uniref:Outer membrane protein beta-barrel domain-containing protein n=1 Tax=Sorangium cellulosum TaxID=56 RepID=A0A2L0EV08_SORCE|nr:hypothetical protein [Sorangium cellulosum]AUX43136.1 hypothetical protein SOCE26_045790 [Sorangium cellulosum]